MSESEAPRNSDPVMMMLNSQIARISVDSSRRLQWYLDMAHRLLQVAKKQEGIGDDEKAFVTYSKLAYLGV